MAKGLKTVVAALGAVFVAGWAVGQAQAQATQTLGPVQGSAQAAPAVRVTAADQTAAVRGVVQRGSALTQRLSQLLEEARREADIIRVTCLNDKLTQANANMRTAQTRLAAFESAPDADRKNHEATVLSVLGQKFQVLDQEANRCVGQDLYETGSTRVLTEIDTAQLPFDDTDSVTQPPPPPAPTVPFTPLVASSTGM